MNYLINFDFEEVNSAVLRNAQLHMRKKHSQDTFGVLVPYQFAALYSNADMVAVMTKETTERFGIGDYKKVLEFGTRLPNMTFAETTQRKFIAIKGMLFEKLTQISKFFGEKAALWTFTHFWFSARQRKYFIGNGLEKHCLNALAQQGKQFQYIRVSDYVDVVDFSVQPFHLGKWFERTFPYIATMIAEGNLYTSRAEGAQVQEKLIQFADPGSQEYVQRFFSTEQPKIVMRTRNFQGKAIMNNSKIEVFKPLAEALVAKGVMVLNLGGPLLELGIQHDLYLETNHNLSFEEELQVCQVADAAVMTGKAGLFTGFASSLVSLIKVDEEWSVSNLGKPVSLLEARKRAGFKDIDVQAFLEQGEFEKAAQTILEDLSQAKRSKEQLINTRVQSQNQQEIIYV
jgi:hypothetical protein